MQRQRGNEVQIGQSVMPFKRVKKLAAIDKTISDFDNTSLKVKKIRGLIEKGICYAGIDRYIPGTLDLVFQGMIERVKTIEQPEDMTCKGKKMLEFELILDKNYYTNLKSLHICFLVKL